MQVNVYFNDIIFIYVTRICYKLERNKQRISNWTILCHPCVTAQDAGSGTVWIECLILFKILQYTATIILNSGPR